MRGIAAFAALCAALFLATLPTAAAGEPLRVGVYAGPGTDGSDRDALIVAFDATDDLELSAVGREELEGALDRLDALVVGGGSGSSLARGLGARGTDALRRFVRRGGGYVGIGAGAYLAARGYNEATGSLVLADAQLVDHAGWRRGTGEVELEGTSDLELPRRWRYQNGPLFTPGAGDLGLPAYEALARFASDIDGKGTMPGRDAILRSSLGDGRVILFSVLAHALPDTRPQLLEAVRWAGARRASRLGGAAPRGEAPRPREVAPPGALRVALLDDAGCIDSCVRASEGCLEGVEPVSGARFWVRRLAGYEVAAGALDGFDVVILPGGSATKQSGALGDLGRARLKAFVARGGGYVGVCAGAYLAAVAPRRYGLGLAAVEVVDTRHWKRGSGMVELGATPGLEAITGRAGDLKMAYYNGPLLAPLDEPGLKPVRPLAAFRSDIHENGAPAGMMPGKLAIAATEFESGRVVLFSTHPELTEGCGSMLARSVAWAGKR